MVLTNRSKKRPRHVVAETNLCEISDTQSLCQNKLPSRTEFSTRVLYFMLFLRFSTQILTQVEDASKPRIPPIS